MIGRDTMLQDMTFEDLTALSAGDAGLSREQARVALTGALGLLDRHAARETLVALFDAVPGAEDVARSEGAARPKRGLFGGLIAGAGGLSGKAVAEAMGLLDQLETLNVSKADLKRLLPAARERLRALTGRDLLGDAVRSVPGVGPLLGDT